MSVINAFNTLTYTFIENRTYMTSLDATNQLCSVTLLGNLVATPEVRYLANPVLAVTDITLATTHRWLDKKTGAKKEWTSFHQIKVVGKLVENTLLHAKKGDVLLVQGYIANNKTAPIEIVHATSVEHFAKGFTHAMNQVLCSAKISSEIQLVTTEHNKQLATFDVDIQHQAYSEHKQKVVAHHVTRNVHVWGKQATYLLQQAQLGAHVIIEGRLSYENSNSHTQYIEVSQLHLVKK